MKLMFDKGTPNKDRKDRKAKRGAKGKVKPESILQQDADDLYKSLGIKTLRIPDWIREFVNDGFFPKWFKDFFNNIVSGWSDNTLLLKNGRYICIELKTEHGTQLPSQKTFEKEVGQDNYHICRSMDEVVLILTEYGVFENDN